MNDNQKMLDCIYKGAEMGRDAITQLEKSVDDEGFRAAIEHQRDEYQSIMDDARKMLRARGHAPEGISTASKISSQVMTGAKTLVDGSIPHMAEMMIQGGTMGVTHITRRMGEMPDIDSEVRDLSQRLLSVEEHGIDHMKQYLK